MRRYILIFCSSILFFLTPSVQAANIEAQLSTSNGSDAFQVQDRNGKALLHVDSSGNTGINTMAPVTKLDVAGTVRIQPQQAPTPGCSMTNAGEIRYEETNNNSTTMICAKVGANAYQWLALNFSTGTQSTVLSNPDYDSGPISFERNKPITRQHNLGVAPSLVIFEFVCIAANNGFSVGDRIPFGARFAGNSSNIAAGYNAKEVFVRFGPLAKFTGKRNEYGVFEPSASTWVIIIRAWK